jgi:hypothetical protein
VGIIVLLRQPLQQFVTSVAGDSLQRLQGTWHRTFNNLSSFSLRTMDIEKHLDTERMVEGEDVRKVERTE